MIRLLLFSLVPGVLVGGFMVLIQYLYNPDDFVYETPWTFISVYAIFTAVLVVRGAFMPANTLWDALKADYPAKPLLPETWPRSAGIIGTAQHGSLSNAISFALKDGLYVQRWRRYLSNTPLIMIPWDRIEKIELIAPDQNSVQEAKTREDRETLTSLLHAKVTLLRNRSPMTLLVPWNEKFNARVPSSIELIRKWDWPFSVL